MTKHTNPEYTWGCVSEENQVSDQKKTRLVGTATTRPCTFCKKVKDRFKDFKPRWSRCAKHRIKGTKGDPNCADCTKLVNGNTRQPKCIECDSKRTTKKAKAPTPVTVAPVAAQAAPAPVETPVAAQVAPVEPANKIEAVATATAAPAPEATTVTLPTAPVAAPAPEAVTVAKVETAPAATVEAPKAPKKGKKGLNALADLKAMFEEPTGSEGSGSGPF
jgi:hypothetical protein